MTALRVLYVEDNDYLRETIAMLIEDDDRAVATAPSAEVAWAHLQAHPVDVLVTDVNLPGESGVELAKRATAERPSLWVLLCTGHDLSAGLAGLGERFRSVLKPFEPEELEAALQEIALQLRSTA